MGFSREPDEQNQACLNYAMARKSYVKAGYKAWVFPSNLPLGHGEKSVIIALQAGLSLTKDEILAIRWHMHAWELPFQSYEAKSCFNVARESTPLVTLIQTADGLSSSLLEK